MEPPGDRQTPPTPPGEAAAAAEMMDSTAAPKEEGRDAGVGEELRLTFSEQTLLVRPV